MSEVVERTELIVPGPAVALARLLDVPLPDLEAGEGMPLLWHWLYTLERPAQADLGPDGHPLRHTVPMPPAPAGRRMWAGGQVRSLGVLRCGQQATRRTQLLSTEVKEGRTGRLTVVTIGHQMLQACEPVIEERRDVVYREGQKAGAPDARSAHQERAESDVEQPLAADEWSIEVTPSLLFQFSALTYNAHRIHYDRDYARSVEGYPGLVVHGPLQAIAMAEAARASGTTGPGVMFAYRLTSPLFEDQGLIARAAAKGSRVHTSVRDRGGRRTAHGVLTPHEPAPTTS